MKELIKSILIAALICSCLNVHAQLDNTKWKRNLNVPDPLECFIIFKNNTMNIMYAGNDVIELRDTSGNTVSTSGKDSIIIEMMQYKYENNELTIHKIKGGSPFDTSCIGKYKIEVKDNKLYISSIHDDCAERANAFGLEPLIKVQ